MTNKTIFSLRYNFSSREYQQFLDFSYFIWFCKARCHMSRWSPSFCDRASRQLSLKSTLIRSWQLRSFRSRCLRIFRVRDLSRKIREKRPGQEIMLRLCVLRVDVSTSGQCYKSFRTHKRLTPRLSCAFLSGISGRPRRNISRYENTRAYEGNLKL